ncbi:MAG: RlmE family RNA methyltransferase [Gammaproteobacteria bacterium]
MAKRSRQWIRRHETDPFVRQARRSEYRSRAVFKLTEIDRHDRLLRAGMTVIDLGAAPGGWSQYVARRVGDQGRVIAVDALPMSPIKHVEFIQGDVSEPETIARCLDLLHGAPADLVISDLAPNLTGIRATDQARSLQLGHSVCAFADAVLRPGGDLLIKVFQGQGMDEFRKELVKRFQRVINRKPRASRDSSREFYVLARGYKV